MTQILQNKQKAISRFSKRVLLDDGASTMVHVVRYHKDSYTPKVVHLDDAPRLLDWCEENGIAEALNGGFFMWDDKKVLGELWVDGIKQDHVGIHEPWNMERGAVHISPEDGLSVGPRHIYKNDEICDMLQAGPVLLRDSEIVVSENDPEGISSASGQFDSDITVGRYPRAAIGVSGEYIWSVVCDGRHVDDDGLTLIELAEVMKNMGVSDALNLDGGGSASQISDMKFRNKSRGIGEVFERGRPVYSAIIFNLI